MSKLSLNNQNTVHLLDNSSLTEKESNKAECFLRDMELSPDWELSNEIDFSFYARNKAKKIWQRWKETLGDSDRMNEKFSKVIQRHSTDRLTKFLQRQDKFELQYRDGVLYLTTYGDLTGICFDLNDVKSSGYSRFEWKEHNGDYSIADSGRNDLCGCPKTIYGSFDCSGNNITTLKDGNMPMVIGGDVDLSMNPLESIEGIQDEIDGSFFIVRCSLPNLRGAPRKVSGALYASYNRFTDLIGCPECDVLDVKNNLLESLEGAPIRVRAILASNNSLRLLKYCPQVSQDAIFSCNRLVSVADAPEKIGGEFFLDNNELESLRGCPLYLKKSLRVENNRLRDLVGAPERIDGEFVCMANPLKSLEGIPEYIGGDLICEETEELSQADIDCIQKKLAIARNENI